MDSLLTPSAAENLVLGDPPALPTEQVPLSAAAGRILAANLSADRPLPPYHRVMMDGICFRSTDLAGETVLSIAGIHGAGAPEPPPLPPGQCWEIMTGACLPSDCDTVIPYEDLTRPDSTRVAFPATSVMPGKFVHRAGSDFVTGDVLAPAYSRIDSRVAAVAATIGATSLPVLRRPTVTVFTTGDEVVAPDSSPAPHQVRQSNASSLHAALQHLGADLVLHQHLPDDEAITKQAVETHLDADLVLLCGGISKGKRDFVRPVIESLRGAPAFHGVAQRPGKPLAYWPGSPPIFALPGNPMSVLVCFHRYVVPLFDAMLHQAGSPRTVQLATPYRFDPPFAYFLPVRLHQEGAVVLAEPKPLANSGDFASSLDSDGFIELPAGQDEFAEGFLAPFREWL